MSKNNIYIYNIDRVCNHKAQSLTLEDLRSFHILPMFKFYLEQADLFGVFKGSKVKIIKSRFSSIEQYSIWDRQKLIDLVEKLQKE